jgi:flagellar hook-associated protein 1 FlgK
VSISAAISTALTGLQATQAGIDLVSSNVSNAGTVGYTRRELVTAEAVSGGRATGVNIVRAQRVLDTLLQKQVRLENAGAGYTAVKESYHTSLDGMFDAPGATGSLPGLVNSFSTAISALAGDPAAFAKRTQLLAAASDLAASLNSLSDQVQSLRQTAEDSLGVAVVRANSLLQQIAQVATRIGSDPANSSNPGLQDQRDGLIDQLSELIDVQVTPRDNGVITISTTGGLLLFDGRQAAQLGFDGKSPLGARSAYDPDPAKRSVGTITVTNPQGGRADAIATGTIRSGSIAALIEVRDEVLPQAQTQLDALAAGLASAFSDRDVTGAAVAGGFALPVAGILNGNPITVSASRGGLPRTVTFSMAGSEEAARAASASGNGVVGLFLGGTAASIDATIKGALGPNFSGTFDGTSLTITAAGGDAVTGLSARATVTSATGAVQVPLFTDDSSPYTGSYENGSQLVGLAARITVNGELRNNSARLVEYTGTTPAGDTARPEHMREAIASRTLSFTGAAGIGGSTSAWTGTVSDFANQLVATQATNALAAKNLDAGQKVVLNALQSRFSEQSGVNIDSEMAQLIQLQTAYGANARVMTAAKDMLDLLMRVGA